MYDLSRREEQEKSVPQPKPVKTGRQQLDDHSKTQSSSSLSGVQVANPATAAVLR